MQDFADGKGRINPHICCKCYEAKSGLVFSSKFLNFICPECFFCALYGKEENKKKEGRNEV